MVDSPPKSAIEIAMEKLARQDAESGAKTESLTDAQKEAIADARRIHEAQVAECRILYDSSMVGLSEPEARLAKEAEYRRDLARFATDRDKRIAAITEGQP